MATNYTGVDLDRYNAGNKFYSQDRYLQGIGLDKPAITFNPSRSNTGIMSQYPGGKLLKYPIIPQYGDGDGGGLIDPGGPDYGYTGPGSTGSPGGFSIDDIGEGTIDDEDIIEGPGLSRMDMARAAGAYMFTGPLGGANSLRRSNNKNKQAEIDEINARIDAQYGPGDPGLRGNNNTPGFGRTAAGNFTNQFDGGDPSQGGGSTGGSTGSMSASDFSDDTAGTPFEYGGRAGYRDGGLTEYEVFKLGELGYNTKGGTVLKPFGGINVLRDILKVNKYAYGGIVGMYR